MDCFCELEKIEDAPASHRRLVITPRWSTPPVLVLDYREVFGYRVIGEAADREGSGEVGWTDRLLGAIPDTGEGVTLAAPERAGSGGQGAGTDESEREEGRGELGIVHLQKFDSAVAEKVDCRRYE